MGRGIHRRFFFKEKQRSDYYKIRRKVTFRRDEKECHWERSQGVVGALGVLILSSLVLNTIIRLLFALFLDIVR